jgi:hypothetical protein
MDESAQSRIALVLLKIGLDITLHRRAHQAHD